MKNRKVIIANISQVKKLLSKLLNKRGESSKGFELLLREYGYTENKEGKWSKKLEKPTDVKAPGEIEDVGEKLGGARKDLARQIKSTIADDDVASHTLSEIWPKPKFEDMDNSFESAFVFAARAEIPSKPRVKFKLQRWADKVRLLRGLAEKILSGEMNEQSLEEAVKRHKFTVRLEGFFNKIAVFQKIDKNLWNTIDKLELNPDAYLYEEDGKTLTPYLSVNRKLYRYKKSFEEIIPDVEKVLKESVDKPKKAMQFEVRGNDRTGYFINKKGDAEYRPLEKFDTAKEALEYKRTHADDLIEEWEKIKAKDNVHKTDVRNKINRARTGKDHRGGKDVGSEEFREAFGFRGVEFGLWVKQGKNAKDRQGMVNAAYDALLDLSGILGIPPKAISLNGDLGLGFGSRGHGAAAAHFEPDTFVINLTKPSGAGSLAHEWFHALDNYFQRERGTGKGREGSFITYRPETIYRNKKTGRELTARPFKFIRENREDWKRVEGIRPEVEKSFADLVKALNESDMYKRSLKLTKGKSDYWSRIIERAARSFESYIIGEMNAADYSNDYLANVRQIEDFEKSHERYPYLTFDELVPIKKAFDNLFKTLKTKETDKGVKLFATKATKPQETITRKDLRKIFSRMKHIRTGQDKDGNLWFKATGRPKVAIYELDNITGHLNTSAGQIPVGSFLRNTIELKTGGEGHTADIGTAYHEFFHWLSKNGILSANDITALNRVIAKDKGISESAVTEEHRAYYVGDNISAWETQKHPRIRRILRKLTDFMNAIYDFAAQAGWVKGRERTAEGVIRDIESGRILKEKKEALAGVNEFAQAVSFSLKKAVKAVTDNPNFVRWFKDSVVKDEVGKPLTVYHGTHRAFSVFDKNWIGSTTDYGYLGQGFYFSQSAEYASDYAKRALQGGNVVPVYLSIQNPFIFEYATSDTAAETRARAKAIGAKLNTSGIPAKPAEFLKQLKANGYDGVIIKTTDKNNEYAVFEPTQIKSIFNTTFDPTNPDIRYQMAGTKAIGAPTGQLVKAQEMLSRMEDIRFKLKGWSGPEIVIAKDGAARKYKIINSKGAYLDRFYTRKEAQAKIDSIAKLAREARGLSKKEVWRKTGWIKTPDNHWKFEIDDSGATLKNKGDWLSTLTNASKEKVRLSSILDHRELYASYPQLKDVVIQLRDWRSQKSTMASYNLETNTIEVARDLNYLDFRASLFHEAQHAIQGIEGFAEGGSPKPFIQKEYDGIAKTERQISSINKKLKAAQGTAEYDKLLDERQKIVDAYQKKEGKHGIGAQERGHQQYERLAGEIEARDTSARAKLTPEQRREQMPYESQGIPEDQWIITDGKGTSFSVEERRTGLGQWEKIGIPRISDYLNNDLQIKGERGNPFPDKMYRWASKKEWENIQKGQKAGLFWNTNLADIGYRNKEKLLFVITNSRDSSFVGELSQGHRQTLEADITEVYGYDKTSQLWKAIKFEEQKAFSVKGGKDYRDMLKRYQVKHTTPLVDETVDKTKIKHFDNLEKTSSQPDWIKDKFGREEKTLKEKIGDNVGAFRKNWQTRLLDRLHPIKALGETAYMLHRLETGAQATMAMFMRHGKLKWEGKALTIDTQKQGFMPWLEGLGDDAQKLFYWMAAKRAEVLETEGREKWLGTDTRKKIFDWVGEKPKSAKSWRILNNQFQDFNKSVLNLAQQSGLINPIKRAAWEQEFYVPFYRIFEDAVAREEFLKGPLMGKKHISAQIKRLLGAEMKIGDPLENVIRNWSHLIHESVRNMARAEAYDYAQKNKIKSSMIGEGDKLMPLIETVKASELNIYRSDKEKRMVYVTKKGDDNILSFQKNGRRIYFKVNDIEMFNALGDVNHRQFNGFLVRACGQAKRWLTYGATFGPAFKVANMLRDSLHTAIISKSFIPFIDSGKGIVKALREDADYVKFMASGAGFGSSYIRAENPQALAEYINRIVKKEGGGSVQRILDTPKKMLDFWEKLGAASENAARVQLYTKRIAEGETHLKAAFEGRDLMDFTMRGDSQVVQYLIRTVPFMNARAQGLYKLGRAAKQDPKSFMVKGSILTIATLALWAINRDKDEWKELEDWDKRTYYHFWIGSKHYRIPKPFETGAIFSTVFEGMAEVMSGDEEFGYFVDVMKDTFLDTFAMNPLPQAVRPLIEQWSNKSFFTGRPIEGQSLQRLKPGERKTAWTSETMQLAGKLGVSPKRAEEIIRGYFSTFGMFLLGISDIFSYHLADFPVTPTKEINDYPLLGRFIKERVPARHTKYQTKFYEMFREIDQLVATVNNHRRLGNYKEATALATKERKNFSKRKGLLKVRKELTEINARLRRTMASRVLTADQKRTKIDGLVERKNKETKRIYERYLE